MGLRITTWNVNGIRNPFGYQPWRQKKTFDAMFDTLEADIVVMQELKIQKKDLTDDMVLVPGWDCYFSLPKHKKGYSGVGIYTRQTKCAPVRAEEGLLGVLCPPNSSIPYRDLPADSCIGGYPTDSQIVELGIDPSVLDAEGRCLVLEFPAFVLFGVYSPANSNGLRDDFRYGFICALDTRIRNLSKMGKRVVLTGDLNISREEIDTAKAEEVMRTEGISRDDYLNAPNRRVFNQLLEGGSVPGERDEGREEPVLWDICRAFHQSRRGMYTHWEQKINARPGNFGSRIDYVICSIEMKGWFSESNIQEGLMGSDHCPVYAVIKEKVELGAEECSILDIMNPPGMFKAGVRQRDFDPTKDLLPFSGKLLPEFNKRRSIKDMFTRKPSLSSSSALDYMVLQSNNGPQSKPEGKLESTGPDGTHRPCNVRLSSTERPIRNIGKTPGKRSLDNFPSLQSAKRHKPVISSSTTERLSKGQQSLKDYLLAKPGELNSSIGSIGVVGRHGKVLPTYLANEDDIVLGSRPETLVNPCPDLDAEAPPTSDHKRLGGEAGAFNVVDTAKESWTKLFSKKSAPRCDGHDEPCIALTTKKPGINCGRQFWICPRPLGPSGSKEKGTEWRCGTFIWASDWNTNKRT
jgi:AP endonuclease-2